MSNYNPDINNKETKLYDSDLYFGQWHTDKIIESYFPNQNTGVCIEIGAANGIKGSNTKYFENLGWDVLCIEPNIKYKESLENNRKLVRYYACGHENVDSVELTVFDIGKSHIMSSLSSLSPDERLVKDHGHLINDKYMMIVDVRTLSWILGNEVSDTPFEGICDIDFVSIDTEGTELDVVRGFDVSKYRVKLFVIENNYEDESIEMYMNSIGYKKDRRYKINDFYTMIERLV